MECFRFVCFFTKRKHRNLQINATRQIGEARVKGQEDLASTFLHHFSVTPTPLPPPNKNSKSNEQPLTLQKKTTLNFYRKRKSFFVKG